MKEEVKMGGGWHICSECGEKVFGSKMHKCNIDHFASVRKSITKSTENSGYTVFIPENAKKSTKQEESWTDIIESWAKTNYGVDEKQLEFWEWLRTYYNPPLKTILLK